MKKAYVPPTAEKLEFQYEKVVAALSGKCGSEWTNDESGGDKCNSYEEVKNFSI